MNFKNEIKSKKYTVYWAKHSHHSNPNTDGYVGQTSTSLIDRKKSHYKTAKSSNRPNVHFHNVLKKYKENIVWIILHEGLSEEEALSKEAEYRPNLNMGWNTDRGGVKAISSEWYQDKKNKTVHSLKTAEATKLGIAEKDTPEARAQRAKAVWDSEGYRVSREGLSSGKNNPQFGKFGTNHPAAGHTKTDAGRKAISAAQKGRFVSQETRDKLSATRIAMFAGQKAKRLTKLEKQKQARKVQRAKDKAAGKFRGETARNSKITDQQRVAICEGRKKGETYKAIAKNYPITLTGVRAICQQWGPENGYPFEKQIGKSDLKKVTSPEVKTAICKEYSEGISAMKLATKYDVTFQTVYAFLADWGPKNNIPYIKQKSD